MNKKDIKKLILETVNNSGAIKNVDLALKVLDKTLPQYFNTTDYHEALEELVKSKDIQEVEYTLANEDRTKSIYFSKGTEIRIQK